MQIRTILSETGRTLKIWASENLDLRLHKDFTNAAIVANYRLIDSIEIDLKNTRVIRDSGLALLLMLSRKTGLQKDHIRLLNCPENLQARLSGSKLASHFQVV